MTMPIMHPHPARPLYLGMREGDLAGKQYAAFWNPHMAPLPAHVKDALLLGPVAAPLLPRLADAPRLLSPGDQELEDGFGLQEDGSLHVAVRTPMPAASPAMADWWFAWHSDEPQRYKLWHPRAHVHAEWGAPAPQGGTDRDRYVGRVSFVDEYVGSQMSHLAIQFRPPAELGFDGSALADPEQATVICARVGYSDHPVDLGYLVHHVRRVAGGAEMRSRFWLGGPYMALRVGGQAGALAIKVVQRFVKPSAADASELLIHCSQEMSHLASFLPALYADSAERRGR